MFRLNSVLGLVFSLACLGTTSTARAQEVGDWVLVASPHGTLVRAGQTVGSIPWGTAIQIESIDGDWLWVNPEHAGWISRSDVVPLSRAIDSLSKELRREPADAWDYVARGNAWYRKGEIQIALEDFREAIRRDRLSYPAYRGLGAAQEAKGEYDEAIGSYTKALSFHSDDPLTYHLRGTAAASLGRYGKALDDEDDAIRLDPSYAAAYDARAAIQYVMGQDDQAIANCTTALRLDPRFAKAYYDRALAWEKKGQFGQAYDDLNRAVRANPNDRDGCEALAQLLATCPDQRYRNGEQALKYAKRACQLAGWNRADCLDTLSSAYAQAGNVEQARSWKEKALALAKDERAEKETRAVQDADRAQRTVEDDYNKIR